MRKLIIRQLKRSIQKSYQTDSAAQWQISLPIMKLKARQGMNGKSIVIFKIFYFNCILPKCNVF